MASTAQRTTGASAQYKADGKKSGFTVDPGPYEAIVQGHVTGSRMGQLIVTIPDWGAGVTPQDANSEGDGTSSASDQIVVSYASPFYGVTYNADTGDMPNTPQTAGQSYGMWFVPPDIGNKVLVTFVAGDMSRGYWFACVYNSPSHHMVPGLARNIGTKTNPPPDSDGLNAKINTGNIKNLPVIEYDISDPDAFTDGFNTTPRYPHEYQSAVLINQGLDQDRVRGAIGSSSLREAPSNAYGISTPGRALGDQSQDPTNPQAVYFRKGGHSFVMDDGADGSGQDPAGTDQLIRLRTSSGHQILMNDTENILYIASASGAQWLEFSNDGSINVYGAAGFNLRSSGPINMHSDAAINMCSPTIAISAIPSTTAVSLPSISIKSVGFLTLGSVLKTQVDADTELTLNSYGEINLAAGGALTMGAVGATTLSAGALMTVASNGSLQLTSPTIGLNCIPTPKAIKPPLPGIPPIPKSLPDTDFNGTNWVGGAKQLLTTVTVAPAHEPWGTSPNRPKAASGLGGALAGLALGAVSSAGIASVASTSQNLVNSVTGAFNS